MLAWQDRETSCDAPQSFVFISMKGLKFTGENYHLRWWHWAGGAGTWLCQESKYRFQENLSMWPECLIHCGQIADQLHCSDGWEMLTLTTLSAVILHSHGRGDGQPRSVLSGKCFTTWGMWEEAGSQGYCALKWAGGRQRWCGKLIWKFPHVRPMGKCTTWASLRTANSMLRQLFEV